MPVGRREAFSKRGRGRNKETNSTYSYKQKTSDESGTESETDERNSGSNSTTEDAVDRATTATTTTAQPQPQPIQSKHTSGHTTCIKRQSVSPRGKTAIPNTADEPQQTKSRKSTKRMILILIMFLVIIGLFSLHQSIKLKREISVVEREPKEIGEVYADLKIEMKRLVREFSQPREVWLGFLSQLELVMVERPTQPAVLLFVVPEDSKLSAVCLAHQLARSIQVAFEDTKFIMYDTGSSSETRDNAALMKVELDEALMGLAEAHAAVVHGVDRIPGQAAMILHAYCDNENAPFKQAILLLLSDVPMKYSEIKQGRVDTFIDSHLTERWGQELKEKDVSALISRTSNAPILVRPEETSRMMELCPL